VIAGTGNSARNAEDRLTTERGNDYLFQGFINCDQEEECVIEGNRVLGHINDINQYFESNSIDEIVIAMPGHFTKEIQKVVKVADYHGIRTIYLPDYSELFGSQYSISKYGEVDAVNVRSVPMDRRFPRYCKSAFDKVFAAVVLILLSPLFLLLSILIKMESPGPVFYCPIRIGRGGRPFKVFKFRSMRENDDSSKGTLSTTENDPRITSLGATLRKYSLDELPQFFNVLMGDMSVVGPRPHRRFLDRQLQASVSNYMIRHYVKPGITGWAQVNGWRGPSTTDIQKKQRTEHDLYYVENWSLLFDIKIILLTFGKKAHSAAY
ncbi:MAG: exopolysaccharide biosynthesis polyprenyl glycosylphosphotransferase, partial [Sphingobacteriales bacterium]